MSTLKTNGANEDYLQPAQQDLLRSDGDQRGGATQMGPVSQPSTLGWAAQAIGHGALQRKLQRRALQRKADGASPDPATASAPAAASGGQPLPDDVRAKLEASFGADFSAVRVHEGPEAAAVGAVAFTQGNDIIFAPGQYRPGTPEGQALLGHELTHVVQQRQGRVQANVQHYGVPINDDEGLEREADVLGARAAQSSDVGFGGAPGAGPSSTILGATSGAAQRKADPTLPALAAAHAAGSSSSSATLLGDDAAGVAQRKLNMTAGYTETLTWGKEAQTLIDTYNKFVALYDVVFGKVKTPNPLLKGNNRKAANKRLAKLTTFRTQLEATAIPNDFKVRTATTEKIEAQIAAATSLDEHIKRSVTPVGTPVVATPEAEDDDGVDAAETEGKTLGFAREDLAVVERGPQKPEDEGSGSAVTDTLRKVEIKLSEDTLFTKVNKGGRVAGGEGSVTASSGNKATLDGISHETKAAMSLLWGKHGEKTTEPKAMSLLGTGHKIVGRAKTEDMVGAKVEGKAEVGLSVGPEGASGALKGSASAFAGMSVEQTVSLSIAGDQTGTLATVTGTAGITFGVGGSYEGELRFEGWTLSFKSKGMIAAGAGFAWGGSIEIDASKAVEKGKGWLARLGEMLEMMSG